MAIQAGIYISISKKPYDNLLKTSGNPVRHPSVLFIAPWKSI